MPIISHRSTPTVCGWASTRLHWRGYRISRTGSAEFATMASSLNCRRSIAACHRARSLDRVSSHCTHRESFNSSTIKIHGYAGDLQIYQHCLPQDMNTLGLRLTRCVKEVEIWMSSKLRLTCLEDGISLAWVAKTTRQQYRFNTNHKQRHRAIKYSSYGCLHGRCD